MSKSDIEMLDIKTKEKIKEIIEYLFKPINGKVQDFGDFYNMTCGSKYGSEPWKKWIETIHPISIATKIGEHELSFRLMNLNKIDDAISMACHDFLYEINISENNRNNILRMLYSQDFLEFMENILNKNKIL